MNPAEIIILCILLIGIIIVSLNIFFQQKEIINLKKQILIKDQKIEENNRDIFQKNKEIESLKARLKFAVKTQPKFNIGDKIASLTIIGIDVYYYKANKTIQFTSLFLKIFAKSLLNTLPKNDETYYLYNVMPDKTIPGEYTDFILSENALIERQKLIKSPKRKNATKK